MSKDPDGFITKQLMSTCTLHKNVQAHQQHPDAQAQSNHVSTATTSTTVSTTIINVESSHSAHSQLPEARKTCRSPRTPHSDSPDQKPQQISKGRHGMLHSPDTPVHTKPRVAHAATKGEQPGASRPLRLWYRQKAHNCTVYWHKQGRRQTRASKKPRTNAEQSKAASNRHTTGHLRQTGHMATG